VRSLAEVTELRLCFFFSFFSPLAYGEPAKGLPLWVLSGTRRSSRRSGSLFSFFPHCKALPRFAPSSRRDEKDLRLAVDSFHYSFFFFLFGVSGRRPLPNPPVLDEKQIAHLGPLFFPSLPSSAAHRPGGRASAPSHSRKTY